MSERNASEPDTIQVLVVDDHAVFRAGLVSVLSSEEGIEVVGEAADGLSGVARAEELVPDVVVMDVRMPELGGIEASRRMSEAQPGIRIIMLTASDEEEDLYEAIKAGASGYLLKEVSIEEVAGAVRGAMRGETLIAPSMANKLIGEFNSLARSQDRTVPVPRLTPRELEVLGLVARGYTNKDIGAELFVSLNTVKNHVRNILDKLHLHSRMEAAMFAVRERLVDPDATA